MSDNTISDVRAGVDEKKSPRENLLADHPLVQLTLVRFLEFIREPEALFWVFVFPILLAAGLGIAFRNRPAEVLRIAVVTPALALEGIARDVVRVIQQARRDLGFDVSDRIALVVGAVSPVAEAVRAHSDFIAGETLATSLTVVDAAELAEVAPQPVGDGGEVRIGLTHS